MTNIKQSRWSVARPENFQKVMVITDGSVQCEILAAIGIIEENA